MMDMVPPRHSPRAEWTTEQAEAWREGILEAARVAESLTGVTVARALRGIARLGPHPEPKPAS